MLRQPPGLDTVIRWTYVFIDRPAERLDAAGAFWSTVTGTRVSARRGEHGEFATLLVDGADAYLKVQGVRAGGGAHLDLAVDDVACARDAASQHGATTVTDSPDLVVMRSPGGLQFCLVPSTGEAVRPGVVDGPAGVRSRLDQVCVDVAPQAYTTELAFWRDFTGWEHRRGARPEFDLVMPPPSLPVRILLQRLDADQPISAHLDLACSDVPATQAWHERCGATALHRWPLWVVMRDPAGGTYCLTVRDPQSGSLPDWARSRL